ncbi:hypothetical protein Hte_008497 [Hypoxylon texense]
MASARPTAGQRDVFGERLSELTTIFTPPCAITWLLTTTKVPSQYPAFPTTGPISCDPPQWVRNIAEKGFGYYSPAICPSGFTAGCTISDERISEGFPPITAGETAMYCVPSGFTCTSDTTDFRGGIWGFHRTASANGASVTVGPAIQIRWQDKDLFDLATDPLIPGVPPIRTTSSRLPTVDTPTPTEVLPSTTAIFYDKYYFNDSKGACRYVVDFGHPARCDNIHQTYGRACTKQRRQPELRYNRAKHAHGCTHGCTRGHLEC